MMYSESYYAEEPQGCESCGRKPDPDTGRTKHRIVGERPTEELIESWIFGDVCEATDECEVEPDGTCEHGHRSWLLVLGLI